MQKLPAEPGGASAFISGREVLLAAVFLVLGGMILWFVVSDSSGPEPDAYVAHDSEPPQEVAAADAAMSADGPAQAGIAADGGAEPAASTAPLAGETPATPPPPPALPPGAAQNSPRVALPAPSAEAAESRSPAPPPARAAVTPPRPAPGDRPASSQGAAASAAGSLTLNEVRVLNQAGGLQILAATDGLPEYKLFRVENPDRVVIDIPGAWLEVPRSGRDLPVSHPVVKQLRIAQNQLEPPMVRLVLEVASFPDLQVVPRADGLVISIE